MRRVVPLILTLATVFTPPTRISAQETKHNFRVPAEGTTPAMAAQQAPRPASFVDELVQGSPWTVTAASGTSTLTLELVFQLEGNTLRVFTQNVNASGVGGSIELLTIPHEVRRG
jgi:hypothetical protein